MNREVLERLRSNPRARAAGARPAARPPARSSRRRLPFLLSSLFILGLATLAFAAWSAMSSPALASMLTVHEATPTQRAAPRFWARAGLAKPAYIPPAIPTVMVSLPEEPAPAPTATEAAPAVPPALISAVIVDESSLPAVDTQTNGDAAPAPYSGNKYILVDISEQHMYVYEDGGLIYSFTASTGMNNSTRAGSFAVQSKIPNAYGSTWDIWMPNWLGIYWSAGLENGIHALPILPNGGILWEGFLGRPISYGCVVLGTYESSLLYDWADYGTPVDIQW